MRGGYQLFYGNFKALNIDLPTIRACTRTLEVSLGLVSISWILKKEKEGSSKKNLGII